MTGVGDVDGDGWLDVLVNEWPGKEVAWFRNPGKDDFVVVSFEQGYRSSNLSNSMRKRQYWIKEGARWKIIYEGSA